MGHNMPFVRTTPNGAWIELRQINEGITKEHIHFEYYVPTLRESRQIAIPTPPTEAAQARPEVSIVIAYHNEEGLARRVLMNLAGVGGVYDVDVIAIDDLSVDNTFTELSSVADPRIQVTRFEENLDYTAAVRHGILKSTGKYVLIIEPLLAEGLFTLSTIIHPLMNHESSAVFVSRFKNEKTGRTWMLNLLSLLIRLVCGIRIKDPFPLGIAYSGEFARKIAEQTVEGDFRLSTLYWLGKRKMPVTEVSMGSCSRPLPYTSFLRSSIAWKWLTYITALLLRSRGP